MKALQIIVEETTENVCDNFCKYSNTGDSENGCEYCQNHNNECPFDKLYKAVGLNENL